MDSSGQAATVPSPKQFRGAILALVREQAQVTPRCPHAPPAGMCGGCSLQAWAYADQVAAKRAALRQLWQHDLPDLAEHIDLVGSPDPFEYRTRMDYVASKGRFGLRRAGKFNYIVDLGECHLIPPSAFVTARSVYEHAVQLGLPDYNLRSHEGFLRYIVVRRSPQNTLLLALVTAAPPDEAADSAVARLAERALASAQVSGFHWLINDTPTDISFGAYRCHWGAATLAMQVGHRTLQIGPNTFFQNNVHLLLPLLEAVRAAVSASPAATIADLYGGVGTIALHLADTAGQIVTVEAVAESAQLAQQNIATNGADNVVALQADTLEYLRAQAPGSLDVVVADPPRTGLGPDVCRELLRLAPARIVYVSCNALTQLDDLRALAGMYRVESLAGYDMFPHTPHLEALAVLARV
jgi:23S rRNA (uracil-5-)-methyltransferase RumA